MSRRRGRDVEAGVLNDIRRLRTLSAARIHDELERLHENKVPSPVPSTKTIQRILRDLPPDESGDWRWDDPENDPEDAQLILPALAQQIEWSQGAQPNLSKKEARVIATLRRTDPTIPVTEALNMVTQYLSAVEEDSPRLLEELQWALAFSPWQSQQHFERYLHVVGDGYFGGRETAWSCWIPSASIEAGLISWPTWMSAESPAVQGARTEKKPKRQKKGGKA